MPLHCIVCGSTAVIPKDAAKAMAILVSIIHGAIQGATASTVSPENTGPHGRILGQLIGVIRAGLAGANSGDIDGTDLSRSIDKYWFSTHDCLCLNCGFYFDQTTL